MDFATRLIPPAYDQVFAMADYYVWGATCIGDGSGRYHLFACRWPKSSQFWGWISHGEIVRAEGDRPEGPYQRVGREPLFDHDVEDPLVWHEDAQYWMLAKDMTAATTATRKATEGANKASQMELLVRGFRPFE